MLCSKDHHDLGLTVSNTLKLKKANGENDNLGLSVDRNNDSDPSYDQMVYATWRTIRLGDSHVKALG